MSRQHHYIKCETEYYQLIESGEKKFDFRKNDRNYQVYDIIILKESVNGVETGRVLEDLEILYILIGPVFGLPEGYCVFNW